MSRVFQFPYQFLLSFLLLLIFVTANIPLTYAEGKVTGGQISKHPAWFKESFLDIAEDISEAADSDKHVMLFMHLNGCPYCKIIKPFSETSTFNSGLCALFFIFNINFWIGRGG